MGAVRVGCGDRESPGFRRARLKRQRRADAADRRSAVVGRRAAEQAPGGAIQLRGGRGLIHLESRRRERGDAE